MPEVRVIEGDSRDVLKRLGDATIDSVVTDPPYALVSITKRFGADNAAPAKGDVYARASAGFMGQQWDTGETAFAVEFWREVYRVLKPGGHVIAFAGTRTYHRLACAVEDAGFEIRDMISWLYGSGFPKSHDVSKGIDKSKGAKRAKIRVDASDVRNPKATGAGRDGTKGATRPWIEEAMANGFHEVDGPEAATPEAAAWQGWGTALKPACEPCVLARKPLQGTVAANVLEHGTGALNIDGCRVEIDESLNGGAYAEAGGRDESQSLRAGSGMNVAGKTTGKAFEQPAGRWPANVIHDGSDEVVEAFPDSDGQRGIVTGLEPSNSGGDVYNVRDRTASGPLRIDDGSAARFFYTAKADATDRLGSRHPTVKPTTLMQYMIRLVTPPGGIVLDPFGGSGSTGVAAVFEGMGAIIIEREPTYAADARRRVEWAKGNGRLTILEKKAPKVKTPEGSQDMFGE